MMKRNNNKETQIKIQSSEKCSQNSPQILKILFFFCFSFAPMIASCVTHSTESAALLLYKIYTRTISKLTQWLFPFWCVTSKWLNVIKKHTGISNVWCCWTIFARAGGVRMCEFRNKSAVTRLTTACLFFFSSSVLRFAFCSARLCLASTLHVQRLFS